MDEKQATSLRILDAASKRFLHYGYQKTTMNEIARDLSMSTGNLYRFYPSKLDIAEALAIKSENVEFYALENIVQQDIPSIDKLRKFAFRIFKDTYDHIAESKKIYEIAQVIINERPQYANRRLERERKLLVQIFEQGIEAKSLSINGDLNETALAFQCATMRFRYGYLPQNADFETIAHDLDLVLDLITSGIASK
ncbi:MAG: TetR/AcrR family transcriptional regulator [Caulobacterales bacterium]|nr:TetR/AcrR family transcriptional regulator [Caulobacterales bacterium]MCA0372492.1 TetR/AcrR family transcriptional regulator [Pseudomonadota bacterium]